MLRNWSGVGNDQTLRCILCIEFGAGGGDIRCSTCWMLRKWFGVVEGVDNVSCIGTHVGCDATGVCVWTGMITFLALVHMLDATRLVWGVG